MSKQSDLNLKTYQPTCSIEALKARAKLYQTIRTFFAERDVLEVAQPFCQFALYGLRVNVSRNQDDGIVRGIPFVVESAELSGFRRTDGGFAADGRITAVARTLQQRGVALQCQAVFSVLAVPPFVEDGFLLDLPV